MVAVEVDGRNFEGGIDFEGDGEAESLAAIAGAGLEGGRLRADP